MEKCIKPHTKRTHAKQRKDFPKDSEVIAVSNFQDVKIGDIGTVIGHCEDGRAFIEFPEPHIGSHTFHFPDGYIARIYRK